MTTDRRIERLYPALTASERVMLILEDRKQGDEADLKIGSTMPRDQEPDVLRLLKDADIANVEIGMLILALHHASETQEWRWRWFQALVAHHNDLAELCEPKTIPMLQPPIDLDAPGDESLAGRAPAVLKGLRDAVVGIADQAQAIAVILKEFSGELGGDPLRPEARQYLDKALERVARLLGDLEPWVGPISCDGEKYREDVTELIEMARGRG